MSSFFKKKKLCFVVGPIGDEGSEIRTHADWLLEGIIEPVMAEFVGFVVKRADDDPRPGLIDSQMITDLLNAELVIADLSFSNPNAFYEIGIRHMVQKPIIHMQLADEKPPFDVSLYRAIKFSRAKFKDLNQAKQDLKRQVEAILAEGYEVENPVTAARGRVRLEENVSPENKVLLDEIKSLTDRVGMLEQRRAADSIETENRELTSSRRIGMLVSTNRPLRGELSGDIDGAIRKAIPFRCRYLTIDDFLVRVSFDEYVSAATRRELRKRVAQLAGVTKVEFVPVDGT